MAPPLLRDLWRTFKREPYLEQRYTINDWLSWVNYAGHTYQLAPSYSLGSKQEEPGASFEGYAQAAYNNNGIVFALNQAR